MSIVFELCLSCVCCLSQAAGLHMSEELSSPAGEKGGSSYNISAAGLDQVQFLLGAGPGEPLRPLSAVASGGESARIMLALKAAPAAAMTGGADKSGSSSFSSSSFPFPTSSSFPPGAQPMSRSIRRITCDNNAGTQSNGCCCCNDSLPYQTSSNA